jgi:hypothetical protein
MPQFKEAFQQRIEVNKTEYGSQLTIVSWFLTMNGAIGEDRTC